MRSRRTPPKKILVCELEVSLARELMAVLGIRSLGVDAEVCSGLAECKTKLQESNPELIFSSYSEDLMALIRSLDHGERPLPVIVVSRHPNAAQWIDAMEAGAADYCAAPFEIQQIRWLVDANTKPTLTTAA
ncbi:MAG TPA: hypothetical protein VM120_06960 [Bryobacteraceae bacterium]|nr:hypothetical protein [Bryobacteraceae bacterium]